MQLSATARALEVLSNIRGEVMPPPGYELRLRVVGGGCAGYIYDMYFDESRAGDKVVDIGVPVLVDEFSALHMSTVQLEYADTDANGGARGFVVKNPTATATCACGASFRP